MLDGREAKEGWIALSSEGKNRKKGCYRRRPRVSGINDRVLEGGEKRK